MKAEDQPLEVDRTLRASVKDGAAFSFMLGTGETYLSAFGIFLRGSPLQIGLLSTLPPLCGALSQLLGVRLLDRTTSRKTLMFRFALVQSFIWILILSIPYLVDESSQALQLLIGSVALYHMCSGIISPSWNSLIGDVVPAKTRGTFFGHRSRISGVTTFLGIISGGVVLNYFTGAGQQMLGFTMIFAFASLARLLSSMWLHQHRDPGHQLNEEDKFSFWQFLIKTPSSNFAKFVLFVSLMNFGVFFSAPYYSVYMLRVLQLSYFEFMILTAAALFTQFLTLQLWGQLSDRYGNRRILEFCAIGLSALPLLWTLSGRVAVLLCIQFLSGVIWAGYNLAAANFLFDAVTPPKRGRCVAYQSLVNAVFVLAGSLCGGYAAGHLSSFIPFHSFFWVPESVFLTIFVCSGVIRLCVVLVFLPLFKEVRDVEHIGSRDLLFRVAHVRAISGITIKPITGIFKKENGGNGSKP